AATLYLTWKLRCERVIANENTPFSDQEVQNKWLTMVNERLNLDSLMSRKYEGKAILKDLVKQTWKGLLHKEHELPDEWTGTNGV
ncbi:hypothetical protein K435DRAFT_563958, partial [Dendrothele bispora CBS 962.96]